VLACPAFIAAIDPSLCRPVDIYCERADAAFWAEPLNALTNLAFLIAAWFAWRATRGGGRDRFIALLIAMIAVIGLGSFAFHTLATRWAAWLDVVPILVFMLLYLWLALRRYLSLPPWLAGLGLALFFALTFGIEALLPAGLLRGGAMYLPALLVMAAMTLAPLPRGARLALAGAAATFFVSYVFRTLDAPLCVSLPIGTHFLWHCLNACVLYLLVKAASLARASDSARWRSVRAPR
jgi:hypothetical protein